jgi:hypothetical protein
MKVLLGDFRGYANAPNKHALNHLQNSTALSFEIRPLRSFETSGADDVMTQRHISADLNPQPHNYENLKSHINSNINHEKHVIMFEKQHFDELLVAGGTLWRRKVTGSIPDSVTGIFH